MQHSDAFIYLEALEMWVKPEERQPQERMAVLMGEG